MPTVPDGSPAMPRGIAIKYHLPGGADTDMVTNSFKFFPVGTGEDFRDLLQAIVASPPDAPKPTKLEQFFASHPNAPKAIGSLPIPDSFADEEYHGIDAFIFVNKSGQRQAVRYVIAPEKLVHITPEEAAKQSPDYLFDDLAKRIAQKPVVFHVKAQLAEPGDQTKDASQPWPDDRKVVDLGVLTLTKVVANSLEVAEEAAVPAHEPHSRYRALRRSAAERARCGLCRLVREAQPVTNAVASRQRAGMPI